MKTFVLKPQDVQGAWYLIDARNQVLGRLATRIAHLLIGKHRPTYTPHVDTGEHVVVINAGQILLTGKKAEQKFYFRHSTKPGHLKHRSYKEMVEKLPARPLQLAVLRMLPKNRLQAKRIRRLHIYVGSEHPHKAQNPVPITIN